MFFSVLMGILTLGFLRPTQYFRRKKKSSTKQTNESIWSILVSFSFSKWNIDIYFKIFWKTFLIFFFQPSTYWKILPYDLPYDT